MWFLLTQIFPLLLLAAILGAVLAYWWLNNRQEGITESHERITERLDALSARPEPAAREDYEAGMALISSAVRSLRMPDMDPVNQRLAAVEGAISGIVMPETDLGPLQAMLEGMDTRLNQIERAITGFTLPETDLRPLENKLDGLESRLTNLAASVAELNNTDLAPIDRRFGQLEESLAAIRLPEVDLGPLHSGLARLDLTIAGLDRPQTDLGPLQTRLAEFESRISLLGDRLEAAQKRDFEKLSSEITSVASGVSGIEMPDLGAVYQRLVSVEHAIASFTIPEPNMTPLYERMAALEESLAAVRANLPGTPDLTLVERRIASLQEAFLTQTPPDLAPVLNAVQSIEGSLDLEAMENRLNAIEYGLAAIHHTLRARPDAGAARPEREPGTRAATTTRRPAGAERRTPPPVTPAPPPPRDLDPINAARREDDEANLLIEAAFGDADDLERINGVGPMLCELLHEIGVFYFWQVAEWSAQDVDWVDEKLMHFKGRIQRDKWVSQAQELAALPGSARRPGS
jgi:predicted flap endonuclease-1-like 5' DNA nuclease